MLQKNYSYFVKNPSCSSDEKERDLREISNVRKKREREREERAPLRPGAQTADPGIDLSP